MHKSYFWVLFFCAAPVQAASFCAEIAGLNARFSYPLGPAVADTVQILRLAAARRQAVMITLREEGRTIAGVPAERLNGPIPVVHPDHAKKLMAKWPAPIQRKKIVFDLRQNDESGHIAQITVQSVFGRELIIETPQRRAITLSDITPSGIKIIGGEPRGPANIEVIQLWAKFVDARQLGVPIRFSIPGEGAKLVGYVTQIERKSGWNTATIVVDEGGQITFRSDDMGRRTELGFWGGWKFNHLPIVDCEVLDTLDELADYDLTKRAKIAFQTSYELDREIEYTLGDEGQRVGRVTQFIMRPFLVVIKNQDDTRYLFQNDSSGRLVYRRWGDPEPENYPANQLSFH